MTNIPKMTRSGALMVVFAGALLLQACAMRQTSASGVAYDGKDYVAALDSVMTTDQGGD
jgi:hypothetical protein